jgi:hypothetical protein
MSRELLNPSVNAANETALSSGKGMGKVTIGGVVLERLVVLNPWSY